MNTRETLILHALKFKQLHNGADNMRFFDQLAEKDPQGADTITKNVCARIPLDLANEMDQLGGLLDLNKREMITLAINDFLDKARGILDEFDALPEGEAA